MGTTTTSAKKEKILSFAGTEDAQKAAEAYIARVGECTKFPKEKLLKIITNGGEKIKKTTGHSALFEHSVDLRRRIYQITDRFKYVSDKIVPPLQSLSTFFRVLKGKWRLRIYPKDSIGWFEFIYIIPPFTLEDKGLKVGFKNIRIKISWGNSLEAFTEVRRIGKGKTHLGKVSRIHPHGSSSSGLFCLGNYTSAAAAAGQKWDFISLFSIYDVAIHTYNRGGAYVSLDAFTNKMGWRCSHCGQWESKWVKGEECHLCHRRFCSKCVWKKVRERDKTTGSCVECKKEEKKEDTTLCSSCFDKKERFFSCGKCGNSVCNEHSRICFSCATSLRCLACAPLKCPFCSGSPCGGHLSKVGEEGIAGICDYCSKSQRDSTKQKAIKDAKKRLEKETKK